MLTTAATNRMNGMDGAPGRAACRGLLERSPERRVRPRRVRVPALTAEAAYSAAKTHPGWPQSPSGAWGWWADQMVVMSTAAFASRIFVNALSE